MIFAVRLRPYNKKQGNGMRTYTSAHSGTVYRVGENRQPSPVKIVEDKEELHELRQFSQFEIMPFDDRDELKHFVGKEVETAARAGKHVYTPAIEEGPTSKKLDLDSILDDDEIEDDDEPEKTAPEVTGSKQSVQPTSDPTKSAPPANTGRKKAAEKKTSAKKTVKKKTGGRRRAKK